MMVQLRNEQARREGAGGTGPGRIEDRGTGSAREALLTPIQREYGTPYPGILQLSGGVTFEASQANQARIFHPEPTVRTDSNEGVGPTKNPTRTSKSKRGNNLREWAWVDSNYRPHAYQAPIKWAKSRQNAVISRVGRTICRFFLKSCRNNPGFIDTITGPIDTPIDTLLGAPPGYR